MYVNISYDRIGLFLLFFALLSANVCDSFFHLPRKMSASSRRKDWPRASSRNRQQQSDFTIMKRGSTSQRREGIGQNRSSKLIDTNIRPSVHTHRRIFISSVRGPLEPRSRPGPILASHSCRPTLVPSCKHEKNTEKIETVDVKKRTIEFCATRECPCCACYA